MCNGVGPKPPEKLHALGKYVDKHLLQLNIDEQQKSGLVDAYRFLKEIRNRDVHDYKANERRLNFTSVNSQFVPAFNILAKTMRENHHPDSVIS